MELNEEIVSTETCRQFASIMEIAEEMKNKTIDMGFAIFMVQHSLAVLNKQVYYARRFDFGDMVEETMKVIKLAEELREKIINPTPIE